MAKKHVVQYFIEMENQYLEMVDNLKELKQLADDNLIAPEEYEQTLKEVSKLKENYERISYIMFLLNRPNKKSKNEDTITKSWYNSLSNASKEALINENNDALATLKELIKKREVGNESTH